MDFKKILGTPAWVTEELRRRSPLQQAKEQITIIGRAPALPSQEGVPQAPIAMSPQKAAEIDTVSRPDTMPKPDTTKIDTITTATPPIQTPASQPSRNTGAGSDGVVEPAEPAGVTHEGERVLNARAAQNIDDDTFMELSKQLENNTIDLNAIRTALKKQALPGYAAGSGATTVEDPNDPNAIEPEPASTTANDALAPTTAEPGASPIPSITAPGKYDTIINQRMATLQSTAAGKNPVMEKQANQALRQFDTRAAAETQATGQQLAASQVMPEASKLAAAGQAQSAIRSGRSDLIGNLAEKNMQTSEAAGAEAATLAASERATTRNKQMEDLQMLLKAGVKENLPAIQTKLQELGINMNTANLQTAEDQDRLNRGMELIATGQASGFSSAQINQSLRAAGLYDTVNQTFGTTVNPWAGDPAASPITAAQGGTATADQARWLIDNGYDLQGQPASGGGLNALYSNLQANTNTVDAEWNSIASSQVFQQLPVDTQQRMRALFEFRLTGGDVPYNITKDPNTGLWVVTPKTEEQITQEQSGAFTGDPWSTEALAKLATPTTPEAKSILTAIVTDITTRHDFSKFNALPADNPARSAISAEIQKQATAWDGQVTRSKLDRWRGNTSFNTPPQVGQMITQGGHTYIVTSGIIDFAESNGRWHNQKFTAIDVDTGKSGTFDSRGGRLNATGFNLPAAQAPQVKPFHISTLQKSFL